MPTSPWLGEVPHPLGLVLGASPVAKWKLCTRWSFDDHGKTRRRPSNIDRALRGGAVLAISSLASFLLITRILGRAHFVSRDDDLLGGMRAVAATVFVIRNSYEQSVGAALSRMAATLLSFALCLVYLLLFPFHSWGMAALIGMAFEISPHKR